MMIRALAVAGLLLAGGAAAAQQLDPNNSDGDNGGFTLEPELNLDGMNEDGTFGQVIEDVTEEKAVTAKGAVIRGLDKLSGELTDLELPNGDSAPVWRLDVTLGECRYPEGNPSGDAYAYLTIRGEGDDSPLFQGWMIASSPALNALDHPRYDVWVLRCITS